MQQLVTYNGLYLLVDFRWSECGIDIEAVKTGNQDIMPIMADEHLEPIADLVILAAKAERGENLERRKTDHGNYA